MKPATPEYIVLFLCYLHKSPNHGKQSYFPGYTLETCCIQILFDPASGMTVFSSVLPGIESLKVLVVFYRISQVKNYLLTFLLETERPATLLEDDV